MFTNLIKAFFALILFALSEMVIIKVYPSAETLTHGIITFSLAFLFGMTSFAVYVGKWEALQDFINKTAIIIGYETLERLAPIAKNEELVNEFLARYGEFSQAKVSELEQIIANLKINAVKEKSELERMYSETINALSETKATAKQMLSEKESLISELQRKLSEREQTLNAWKAKYEVLETGTDEQRKELLGAMYRSMVNKLNAMKK
jgi:HPt (histidine-containing phosphotransfer) domain-containing protein